METNELLLHITKKLESKELELLNMPNGEIYLRNPEKYHLASHRIKVGHLEGVTFNTILKPYDENWNNEFKENFYKEKAIKCWTKNCPNKILQKDGDHKKIKLQCQEKHTRMVCLKCADMDAIEKLAQGEED